MSHNLSTEYLKTLYIFFFDNLSNDSNKRLNQHDHFITSILKRALFQPFRINNPWSSLLPQKIMKNLQSYTLHNFNPIPLLDDASLSQY